MAKREITKKTIAVSIDVRLEQKLRRVAKTEGRTVSFIVERSIAQAITKKEILTLAELTEQNRMLWEQLQIINDALSVLGVWRLVGKDEKKGAIERVLALQDTIKGDSHSRVVGEPLYNIELEPAYGLSGSNGKPKNDGGKLESQNQD